jgi:hypothetical protein
MSNQVQLNVDETVLQVHENIKLLCQSEEPCIKNLAILMLALSRQLVMVTDPFHVEYIHDFE